MQVAVLPLPSDALQVMVAVPAALAVTNPELLTVAMLVLLEDHVTDLFVALLGVIVAESCLVFPTIRDAEVALSEMPVTLTMVWGVTVILHVAVFPLPSDARQVMVAVPVALAVTNP